VLKSADRHDKQCHTDMAPFQYRCGAVMKKRFVSSFLALNLMLSAIPGKGNSSSVYFAVFHCSPL
jgi:hypothetical protein